MFFIKNCCKFPVRRTFCIKYFTDGFLINFRYVIEIFYNLNLFWIESILFFVTGFRLILNQIVIFETFFKSS